MARCGRPTISSRVRVRRAAASARRSTAASRERNARVRGRSASCIVAARRLTAGRRVLPARFMRSSRSTSVAASAAPPPEAGGAAAHQDRAARRRGTSASRADGADVEVVGVARDERRRRAATSWSGRWGCSARGHLLDLGHRRRQGQRVDAAARGQRRRRRCSSCSRPRAPRDARLDPRGRRGRRASRRRDGAVVPASARSTTRADQPPEEQERASAGWRAPSPLRSMRRSSARAVGARQRRQRLQGGTRPPLRAAAAVPRRSAGRAPRAARRRRGRARARGARARIAREPNAATRRAAARAAAERRAGEGAPCTRRRRRGRSPRLQHARRSRDGACARGRVPSSASAHATPAMRRELGCNSRARGSDRLYLRARG